MQTLIEAANAAAVAIESAAHDLAVSFSASQTFYGVEAEALVGEEWVRAKDLEDGAEVEAVRLFDCDGERSAICSTVAEVEAERDDWINLYEPDYLQESE